MKVKSVPAAKRVSVTADDLRSLPNSEVAEILRKLGPTKSEELRYNWDFWARPEQIEPKGEWSVWLALAGRGWGKTRAGAEWVRHRIKKGDKIVHCVAPTKGDVRRVMVEGDSGLLNVCWKGDKTYRGKHLGFPVWSPTNNTLTWENEAKAVFFSAEDPERLRGPQAFSAWTDELCAWRNAQETWDMMMFGLRLGRKPQVFITTTPKTTKLLRGIIADENTVVSKGSTFDNSANLAGSFIEAVRKTYEGTRLGRQELYAEVLDEASGALWNRNLLHKCEMDKDDVPQLSRIIVSIDPAISSNAESDMTGIVVAGIDVNGLLKPLNCIISTWLTVSLRRRTKVVIWSDTLCIPKTKPCL
jgi:phage terminase large subunit-like protein